MRNFDSLKRKVAALAVTHIGSRPLKFATAITLDTGTTIEATAHAAIYPDAASDPLAIRLRWSQRSGYASPATLDGDVADWAQRRYVAAAKRAIVRARDRVTA